MSKLPNNIFAGKDSLQQFSQFISTHSFSSVFVLTDENTFKHCYPKLIEYLPQHNTIQIEAGEENKTLAACERIWGKLTEENADRNSLLINLGGGVIGDMGGFAAGCYKRGIKFINIPTTLLSMVDASVGAKTGIDFMGFKNQIGLFNQPEAIFADTDFLKTLATRELLSGFAEVIKHYLIANAEEFNSLVTKKLPLAELNWNEVVEKNIFIKACIVEEDPLEKNIRKALNFGHTIGHAIESHFLKSENEKMLHGEAVALGMICETYLSYQNKSVSEDELKTTVDFLLNLYKLPVLPEKHFKEMLQMIKQDKKNTSGKNQFTLLKGIGSFSIDNHIDDAAIIESFRYYNSMHE